MEIATAPPDCAAAYDWRHIGNGWDSILKPAFASPSFAALTALLDEAYATQTVYPSRENIFTALRLTPPQCVRAVILGQDPYINPGQAHGLAFSVQVGQPMPPSLQNMMKERQTDLGIPPPPHGCLEGWARQGVLLLNTVLTVLQGRSQSHAGQGWEEFTDAVIAHLGAQDAPLVFLLWGRPAQKKEALITNPAHKVLKAPHPSPLSASGGFFGSRPFSRCNEFLSEHNPPAVRW